MREYVVMSKHPGIIFGSLRSIFVCTLRFSKGILEFSIFLEISFLNFKYSCPKKWNISFCNLFRFRSRIKSSEK